MRQPEQLRAAIQRETEKVDRRTLARASAELTRQYKAQVFSTPVIRNEAQRAAYLAVRLPATYAASWRVFAEVRRLAPEEGVTSILDLGAGPGTALWAAAEVFPSLNQATLMESDDAWVRLGRSLAADSPHSALRRAQWVRQDLRSAQDYPEHDLVVIAYALGELPPSAAEALLRRAWSWARKFLVIIEPGTMRGFAVVNTARSALIAGQAEILAPCPHRAACPMAEAGDWCHFSQRVERTSLHRQLKGGALAYEDEKFSYIVASRQSAPGAVARIVRHPRKSSGHVRLTLCTLGGIATRTVTRSEKQAYKRARQAEWGGTWRE